MNNYTRAQLTEAIRACEEMEAGPSLDKAIINALLSRDDFRMNWPDEVPLMSEYTSRPYDLTAAMGLVPEGFVWRTEVTWEKDFRAVVAEHVSDYDRQEDEDDVSPKISVKSSPSHTLTLAALRAQLSLLKE